MEVFEVHAHEVGEIVIAEGRMYNERIDYEDMSRIEIGRGEEGASDGAH
jgi:hypothetical protein